jgi:hypothetical protein
MVKVEWLKPLTIEHFLMMVVLCGYPFYEWKVIMRQGGVTRGKWGIPDGKGGE